MSDLQQQFEEAAEAVKNLKSRPNDETLLELYGLYKQATVGDNTTPRPGMFDFKAAKKWEAWKGFESVPRDRAMKRYIRVVKTLT